jgi:protease-4
MKRFLLTFLACLLAIMVTILVPIGMIAAKSGQQPKIKSNSWLLLNLGGALPEYPATATLPPPIGGQEASLTGVLEALEKGQADKRIKGVLLHVGMLDAGWATREEIRNALRRFRASGKPAYAWSEYYGPSDYLLASACDSIFLLPTGGMHWTGFGGRVPFVKRALEKLAIKPDIHKIERYKTAAELVLREDMSAESREEATRLLDGFYGRFLNTVAAERRITREEAEAAMQKAELTPGEALEAKLVDGLEYWQTIEDRLKGKDEKLRTVTLDRYESVKRGSVHLEGRKKIAVVHAIGMIGGRQSGTNPLLGRTMGSDSVVGDLRRAMEDDDVAAVIFRIDSNGGESVTSDLIGHAVERVKGEKPIVVSMVDVAASGGYSIAYRGTTILADTTTITGSIGSISGKMNMRGLYEKLGITFDGASIGPNALFWSALDDWTDEQRALHARNHWASYNQWIADIARARGLTPAQVDSAGRGRVWTGPEAIDRKLIDGLGDFSVALARAKDLAEIKADQKVTIVHYPKRKGLIETLTSGGVPDAIGLLLDRWAASRIASLTGLQGRETTWQVADPMWE